MHEKVRITFEVPKKLVEFVDKECTERNVEEIITWDRSKFLRELIIKAKREKEIKEKNQGHLKWNLPKEKTKDEYEGQYDDLLNLSGYKRSE